MPGALTQAVSLSLFLFTTLGNQLNVDVDDYDSIPWREMAQGILAASAFFLATVSSLAYTQKEFFNAYAVIKPLFTMRTAAARSTLTLPLDAAAPMAADRGQEEQGIFQRIALITNICLRLAIFMLLMVVVTCVVAMVLADSPGWATFIHNLPLDSAAKFAVAICNGLRTFGKAMGAKVLDQLTSEDSLLITLLPSSMAQGCVYASAVLVEVMHSVTVLARNAWILLSIPVKYIATLSSDEDGAVSGPLRFFLGWVCWHGGYLMPWQPYSVGAGIATTKAIHGAANSLTTELGTLAFPCLTAMGSISAVMSIFGMQMLGPVCAKYRSVYRVSQLHLLIAVVCATHIFCFFSFDTVRALAMKAHPILGLDDVPEHDNFNWISPSVYDPLNPTNVHALARPLQLFCDISAAATMLVMGYVYRDPAGGSVFRRRRRSSVDLELDVTSCSAAVDDSPVCSATGIVGLDEAARNGLQGTGGSSDVEDDERHMYGAGNNGSEPALAKVQEETEGHGNDDDAGGSLSGKDNGSGYEDGANADREDLDEDEEDEGPLAQNHSFDRLLRGVDADNTSVSHDLSPDDSGAEEELLRRTQMSQERKARSPYCQPVHTPLEHGRIVTRSAARRQQQLQHEQSRSATGGRGRRPTTGGPRGVSSVVGSRGNTQEDDEILATIPRQSDATGASGSPLYVLSHQDRTQVATVEVSRDEAGTGGQGDKELLHREFAERLADRRRIGHTVQSVTSQSSVSHMDRSDSERSSGSALLKKKAATQQPGWAGDITGVQGGDPRVAKATQKNLVAVGRNSRIPSCGPSSLKGVNGPSQRASTNENRHPAKIGPFLKAP